MKMIYIAHPFLGKQENVEDAQRIILKLLKLYPDVTFYSPLHATGFFYNEISYEDGMEHCFEALKRCDELWLCPEWEKSKGCNLEMEYAKENGIPVKRINTNGELTSVIRIETIGDGSYTMYLDDKWVCSNNAFESTINLFKMLHSKGEI